MGTQALKTYDLKLVQFVIGGRDISGYAEDGGIEIAPSADIGTPAVGSVGDSVFSRSNNFSGLVTVTLGEWTQGYADLAQLMQEQEKIEGALEPLNLLIRDPLNGDKFSDQWAAFTKRPNGDKGATAGERVFEIFCPNLFNPETVVLGEENLGV
jgi:hypothetical protein